MRRNRIGGDHNMGRFHQLLVGFEMTGVPGQSMHHPKMRQGQRDGTLRPRHTQALDVEAEIADLLNLAGGRIRLGLDPGIGHLGTLSPQKNEHYPHRKG